MGDGLAYHRPILGPAIASNSPGRCYLFFCPIEYFLLRVRQPMFPYHRSPLSSFRIFAVGQPEGCFCRNMQADRRTLLSTCNLLSVQSQHLQKTSKAPKLEKQFSRQNHPFVAQDAIYSRAVQSPEFARAKAAPRGLVQMGIFMESDGCPQRR